MSAPLESNCILVVDDDPISSSLEAHMLALLGFSARIEPLPERALALTRTGRFDAMLLDIDMPGLDGFETLALLRTSEAESQAPAFPVIAVTGYGSLADRARCISAGFNEHLTKPVAAGLLGAALERVLAERGRASTQMRSSDAERLRRTVARLGEVKPGDRTFAPTVIESFALRSAQLIEAMDAAVRSGDFEAGSRSARALKSSAEFLGALGLASLCGDAAGFCDRANRGAAQEAVRRIDAEHQAVLTLLLSRPTTGS